MDGRDQVPLGRRSSDPDIVAMQETLFEIQKTLGEVHDEAKKTNGRVTALETARAVSEALANQSTLGRDWLLRVFVAVFTMVSIVEPIAFFVLR